MTASLPPALAVAPFVSSVRRVKPEWIDYNGHLNMAYYNVLFDTAVDEFYALLGIGADYLKRGFSTFTAECHVRYLREIGLTDPVRVSLVLVAVDAKRMHTFKQLIHAEEGWVSATSENLSLHVDMGARKVAPFPPDIAERLTATAQAHAAAPRDPAIGRRVAMPA